MSKQTTDNTASGMAIGFVITCMFWIAISFATDTAIIEDEVKLAQEYCRMNDGIKSLNIKLYPASNWVTCNNDGQFWLVEQQ